MGVAGRGVGRGMAAVWLLVFGVYAVALWFERYGVRAATHGADLNVYEADARAIASGRPPYRTQYFEYPPGALAPILAPEPFSNYATAFKSMVAVLGGGTLAAAAVCLRGQERRIVWPLLAMAVAPLAVGSVFVNRFDVWPALLTVAALAFLVRERPLAAFALLAAGAATKIFPAAALPAAAVWVWRRYGARTLKRALTAFVGTGLLILLPFAVLGPGGLRFSFTIQLSRHLQTESLGGSILLVADRLGLYRPTIATGTPGSLDLFGTLPTAVGIVSLLVIVTLTGYGASLLARGPTDTEHMITGAAAAVSVYVAFGKVLSPQYLIWLIPLVPLVRRRPGAIATLLLLGVLVLTQIEFDHHYSQLHTAGPVVWTLLARNLLLVTLTALLLRATSPRRRASGWGEGVAGRPTR